MKHAIGCVELSNGGLINDEQVAVIKPLINDLAPMLNAYLKSIGPTGDEDPATNDQ